MAPGGIPTAALRTWAASCTRCHGIIGGGDGPERKDLPVPNFTDPAWHGTRSDEQLKVSIVGGKNQMPAFPELRGQVDDLVRLLRMMGSQGTSAADGPPTPSATAPSAATPSAATPSATALP